MQEEQTQQPKKRGRKPKTQSPAEEMPANGAEAQDFQETPAPKKRGRKPKNADAAQDAPQAETAGAETSAPKKRRGRPPRADGPQWRDAPAAPEQPEDAPQEERGESLFVPPERDDFAYAHGEAAPEQNQDDGDIPTSYSTTDEDLLQDNYSWARGDDESFPVETAPMEGGNPAADARQQRPAQNQENFSGQNFDGRQNNGRNKWRKDRFNKNQQGGQQNRGGQNNNRFSRNQNQNQRGSQPQGGQQNKNRQQGGQQNQPQKNRQNKPKWMQPTLEEDTINPSDLFDWDALKSPAGIEKYLAKIYFGKDEPEPAQPSPEGENAPRQSDPAADAGADAETAEALAAPQNAAPEGEIPSEREGESEYEAEPPSAPAEEPAQGAAEAKVPDYWEMLERSNKKMFATATAGETPPQEAAQESSSPAQDGVGAQPAQESPSDAPFSEDFTMRVEGCGVLESVENFDEAYAQPLKQMRQTLGLEENTRAGANKNAILREFYASALANKKLVKVSGILDVFENGFGGAITFASDNYRLRSFCVYVPKIFIDKYSLARGHRLVVLAAPPRREGGCPFAVKICSAMGGDPARIKDIQAFNDLVPYYPTERIIMESSAHEPRPNISMRAVDLLAPVGLGQRALIVAPPRTGKTVLMQNMAKSIRANKPDAKLIVLLVDERPEEVTDFKRSVDAEVVASTFDEEAASHVHAAEMVISMARRLVEFGGDVIILLDSITRLARAYNALMPNGGRTMSGGVEANALQKPKKFFGSARNIEGGGSLTIIATALIETGSKMDEVIFEEFKGTGNLELHLDRALSDKRIFPAINMEKTGTRKEELLYHPDELEKIYTLRRAMHGVPIVESMELLLQRLKKTKTNVEFLLGLNR